MIGFAFIITGLIILTIEQQLLPSDDKTQKAKEPDLFVLFGSQTGCAERLSIILTDEGNAQGLSVKLYDLEEYDQIPDFESKLCIFLVATHGEGEPTDNSKPFLKWFKQQEKLEPRFLAKFKFAVFGLGSREYEFYNAMGKKFNKILEEAGGQRQNQFSFFIIDLNRIYKYGEGDDSVIGRLEENFNQWKKGIWDSLKETQFTHKISSKVKDQTKYDIIFTNKQAVDFDHFPNNQLEFQTKKQLLSKQFKVKEIRQLRQNLNDGSTLQLKIEPLDKSFSYQVSQNLDIFPINTTKKCEEVAQLLELHLEQIVEIIPQNNNQKFPFPSPISVKDILKRFCDFQGIVMQAVHQINYKIALNQEYQEKLAYLSSDEGKIDYEKEILQEMKTLIDLLKAYQIKPTFAQFIELTTRITPRTYTISSSPINSPTSLDLTIHIQEDILPNNMAKKGIASQFFEDIQNNLEQPLFLAQYRESPFILPLDKNIPIIMISIGCGIAPFIGFLKENEALFEKKEAIYSNMILYYGCRHQHGDFIYRDELQEYERRGVLKKLHLAFSRDHDKKIYVQNLINQTSEELSNYIEKGVFYMCGKASMGKDIVNEIVNIFVEKKEMTQEQAVQKLKQMEENKQFIKELWG